MGKYDHSSGPAHGSKDLLGTKNAIVKHLMGFKITPEPPIESTESLPVYNLSEFSMESVANSSLSSSKPGNPSFNTCRRHAQSELPEQFKAVKSVYSPQEN
ncbi:hypothetical protein TWF481_006663 [Arthrobotrys musiformis]|uniref:Uncharacterized protein n=1 Tax=Arthrobotrys musiformis TaxID=47236 RepID=A0AAV9W970_9PEZI